MARTFPGNSYDGHILSAVLEQAQNTTQDMSVVFSSVLWVIWGSVAWMQTTWVQTIHRGKFKSPGPKQKGWLRRRQAVEPAIGHLKSDHRLDRCWLQGAMGDALHAISCVAVNNLRWLLRAIARLGTGPLFLCLLQMAPWLAPAPRTSSRAPSRT